MTFLIEDLTPRELRVPGGPVAEHPNGAVAIRSLEIATPDAEGAMRAFAALTGSTGAPGTSLGLGPCVLSLVTPEQEVEARRRLDASGPGPLAVGLATDVPGQAEELDRRLSQGVIIRLLERAAGV